MLATTGNDATDGVPSLYAISTHAHHDRMLLTNFNMHIVAKAPHATEVVQYEDMMCFNYPADTVIAYLHVATSLISEEQARANFQAEVSIK